MNNLLKKTFLNNTSKYTNKNIFNNKFSFLKINSKQIHYNNNYNYFEPNNTDEEIDDVKQFLIKHNPDFLAVHFTNTWNPICKENFPLYKKFTSKTGHFQHLLIDTDKFPKLRWYFDCRRDPSFQFYFHGQILEKQGGCDYERAIKNMKRIHDYVNESSAVVGNAKADKLTYEQPYFDYERNLTSTGMRYTMDAPQGTQAMWFSGVTTFFRYMPLEDNLSAKRIYK